MWNVNSGYVGQSMSVRARMAYDDGEKPLSKWSKASIVEVIADILESESEYMKLEITVKDFEKLTLVQLREEYLMYSSWHHTGKYFNETTFYSVDVDKVLKTTIEEIDKMVKERKAKAKTTKKKKEKKKTEETRRVKARWREATSSRSSKAVEGYGTIKGNWFYPDNEYYKKSINSRNFEILCEECDFGKKYIYKKEIKKGDNVLLEVEGEKFRRVVSKDKKGLYVNISGSKMRIEEFEFAKIG